MANSRERGYALLIVLWVMVLLSAIGIHVAATGRTEANIAFNLVRNAKAQAMADAGIYRAIYASIDPQSPQAWAADGAPHELSLPDGTDTVWIEDENGKINPNQAPPELLAALLRELGLKPDSASRLATAIGIWVTPDDGTRRPGTVEADYRAADLNYLPPGEPVETVDELSRVLGMTPEILAAMRPYLSVFANSSVPDPSVAPPLVRRAIADVPSLGAQGDTDQGTNSMAARMLSITAVARTTTGATFVRHAVVEVDGQGGTQNYLVHAWKREDLPQR